MAKRNSFITELVGEEVTLVGGDVGVYVNWTRKGCSKPREKTQESEALHKTTSHDDLQYVWRTQMSPARFWDYLGGNEIDGDLCSKLDFLHRCLEYII